MTDVAVDVMDKPDGGDVPPVSLFALTAVVAWQLPRAAQIVVTLWVAVESWCQVRQVRDARVGDRFGRIRQSLARSSNVLASLAVLAGGLHVTDMVWARWPLQWLAVCSTVGTTVCWFWKRPQRSRAKIVTGIDMLFRPNSPLRSVAESVNKFLERRWIDRLLQSEDGHPNGLMTLALLGVVVSGIALLAQTHLPDDELSPWGWARELIEEVADGDEAPVTVGGESTEESEDESGSGVDSGSEIVETGELEEPAASGPGVEVEGAVASRQGGGSDCRESLREWLEGTSLTLEDRRAGFAAAVEEYERFGSAQLGCPTTLEEGPEIVVVRLEGGIGGDTAVVLDETNDPAVIFTAMLPELDDRIGELRQVGDRVDFGVGNLYRFVYRDYSCGLFVDVFGVTDGYTELPATVTRLIAPLAAELDAIPFVKGADDDTLTVGFVGSVSSGDGRASPVMLAPIIVMYDGEKDTAVLEGVGMIDGESDWCHPALEQIERVAADLAE